MFLFILLALKIATYNPISQHIFSQIANPTSPAQKLAQEPQDKAIKVRTQNGDTLCYIPTFSLGADRGSYVGLLNCELQEAIPARYDVFGRLSFNINNTWLCITAPYSVGVEGRGYEYVYLAPCVLNASLQQWQIKDGQFYSHDGRYSIKDDGQYLFAARKLTNLKTHRLDDSMQEWAKTLAKPGNLSVVTTISWDLMHKDGQERYFLYNNASQKNSTSLFYNLANGHIAQYDPVGGVLQCMNSHTGKKNWDWITWEYCTDSKSHDNAYFSFVPLSFDSYALQDKYGNVLRLTRYGAHWGVPYTANKQYIANDTSNSPTSTFGLSGSMQIWLRFALANVGRNLTQCPAKGEKASLSQTPPILPFDFNLTSAWIQRLYEINITADNEIVRSGICGVCLLQTFEMIAELLHNPNSPMQSGGIFFETGERQNPFTLFRQRNSILHDTLNDIVEFYEVIGEGGYFARAADRTLASAISMLPQYNWHTIGASIQREQILNLLDRMIQAPVGSVFLVIMGRRHVDTQNILGHAVMGMRLNQGVIVVPSNAPNLSLQAFTQRMNPVHTREGLEYALTRYGTTNLELIALGLLEVSGSYHNPYEELVSVHNCTGDGEGRRGSGVLPLPELINQCISGRCEW